MRIKNYDDDPLIARRALSIGAHRFAPAQVIPEAVWSGLDAGERARLVNTRDVLPKSETHHNLTGEGYP
ncbi:MAG: hypothetical protein ACREXS_04605 [Gammaproteobacteria bacterium]